MIDSFITRPILKATTYAKRNTGLVIIILVVLWFLPTLPAAILQFSIWFAGKKIGAFIGPKLAALSDWIFNNPKAWWGIIFVISIFMPLLGAFLTLWGLMDKFKADRGGKTTPSPAPTPTAPAPSISGPAVDQSPLQRLGGMIGARASDWLGENAKGLFGFGL